MNLVYVVKYRAEIVAIFDAFDLLFEAFKEVYDVRKWVFHYNTYTGWPYGKDEFASAPFVVTLVTLNMVKSPELLGWS